jgi:sugar lactone lactonase YvrE
MLLQIVVGAAALVSSIGHVVAWPRLQILYASRHSAPIARIGLGLIEGFAGLWMLAAIAIPFFAFFAASLLAVVTVGALIAAAIRRSPGRGLPAFACLAASVAIALLQPLGLRVLALPKPDALPLDPVAGFEVLKTDAPGMSYESVKRAADGTLFLAGNQGQDFTTGDKSQVQAQVIARAPDGSERAFFKLPKESTGGVMAFGSNGTLYMSGQGAETGVWRITPDGRGTLFAHLPDGAWPNGLAFGPDGQLYGPDSALGRIWRVDPASGAVSVALESDRLRARPFIALAPGANGLHFHGDDMVVTVSDSGEILKARLNPAGRFGDLSVFARGIPGDDFAIAPDGTLYVTTHPFNTIVRVAPDGTRTIVADAHQAIVGATDAALGVDADGAMTLYVVTDGGAFSSGDKTAAGTLVALRLSKPN